MANTTTGLFDTMVAAAQDSAAQMATKYQNKMLDSVYYAYSPIAQGAVGQTIQINIPAANEGNVVDIGQGDIQVTDTDHTTVNLTINKKFSTAFRVSGYTQSLTSQNLQQLYTDERMESLLRKMNRFLASFITSTNFNSYTQITGGADVFTRSHLTTAKRNLALTGVPDDGQLRFITHTTPYHNMLNDSSFSQESIVGAAPADETRKGVFMPQLGFELMHDQHIPVPSAGTYNALAFHPYAIAARCLVEPSQQDGSIKETLVYPRPNVPVKIQMWNSGDKQGRIVHMSIVCGAAVVRPEFGSILVTT